MSLHEGREGGQSEKVCYWRCSKSEPVEASCGAKKGGGCH